MIWIWIALAVLIISIIGIAVILIGKFPVVAAVDVAHAPVGAQKKAELVENRLRRKFTSFWVGIGERSRPLANRLSGTFAKTQARLRDLEHEYKVRSLPVLLDRRQRHRLNEEIQTLLDQAEACVVEGEGKVAEEKLLQAIRMEPRSVSAFDQLGDQYLRSGEYAHAKEVYRYLEKLIDEPDAIYDHHSEEANQAAREQKQSRLVRYQERLAECYQGLEDMPVAFDCIQVAYRLAPTNPKILDTYLDIAIKLGKKAFAADALDQLRTVNPENTKIVDWEAAIVALPDTHLTTADSEVKITSTTIPLE